MTDLDDLMSRDPLELSKQDIADIIAYHRRLRAKKAAGEKPIKPKVDISSSISNLLENMKPAAPEIKRRF